MSYSNLISSSVDTAFSALGDLVQTATLTNSSNESYTFPEVDGFGNLVSGGSTTATTTTSLDVNVIVEETKLETNKEGVSVTLKTLLVKSSDLLDPSVYDTLTFGSKTHTIVSYTRDMAMLQLVVTEV